MTGEAGTSLLGFLDAPVLVGDPEGKAVYANPAFERRFGVKAAELSGRALASLFSGGARERLLQAVAVVCGAGRAMRFRVREGGVGYWALVSPIRRGGEGLGVILLLTEEAPADELSPGSAPPSAERELREERTARPVLTSQATFDPARVVRFVSELTLPLIRNCGARLDVLAPSSLPSVAGSATSLGRSLADFVRDRLRSARSGDVFTLSARRSADTDDAGLLIALVEPARRRAAPARIETDRLRRLVEEMGGRLHQLDEFEAGRVTAFDLPRAPSAAI